VVDGDRVQANLETKQLLVVDARSPDRFRGENETIDPVAGHIPGAVNRFFRENLTPEGRFQAPGALRAAFLSLHGERTPDRIVAQCGSGVTACHNLLAMEIAGLPGAALYPGSWSEWIARPDAPISRA
jgi:thiosulfate/3-mercaptopyruvate sulfurtransferase